MVKSPNDKQRVTNWDGTGTAPANLSWWNFPGLVERWMIGSGMQPPPRESIGVK